MTEGGGRNAQRLVLLVPREAQRSLAEDVTINQEQAAPFIEPHEAHVCILTVHRQHVSHSIDVLLLAEAVVGRELTQIIEKLHAIVFTQRVKVMHTRRKYFAVVE